MSALSVLTAQVDAFNAHDLERFVATYAEDAVIAGAADHVIEGHAAMRAHYAQRLANPDLRCDIDATVIFGDRWVVAREQISNGAGLIEVIATFEVVAGVIRRASMLKNDGSDTQV